MSLIPPLGKQRQADLYELEASLIYRTRSRAIHNNPVSKITTTKKKKEEEEGGGGGRRRGGRRGGWTW